MSASGASQQFTSVTFDRLERTSPSTVRLSVTWSVRALGRLVAQAKPKQKVSTKPFVVRHDPFAYLCNAEEEVGVEDPAASRVEAAEGDGGSRRRIAPVHDAETGGGSISLSNADTGGAGGGAAGGALFARYSVSQLIGCQLPAPDNVDAVAQWMPTSSASADGAMPLWSSWKLQIYPKGADAEGGSGPLPPRFSLLQNVDIGLVLVGGTFSSTGSAFLQSDASEPGPETPGNWEAGEEEACLCGQQLNAAGASLGFVARAPLWGPASHPAVRRGTLPIANMLQWVRTVVDDSLAPRRRRRRRRVLPTIGGATAAASSTPPHGSAVTSVSVGPGVEGIRRFAVRFEVAGLTGGMSAPYEGDIDAATCTGQCLIRKPAAVAAAHAQTESSTRQEAVLDDEVTFHVFIDIEEQRATALEACMTAFRRNVEMRPSERTSSAPAGSLGNHTTTSANRASHDDAHRVADGNDAGADRGAASLLSAVMSHSTSLLGRVTGAHEDALVTTSDTTAFAAQMRRRDDGGAEEGNAEGSQSGDVTTNVLVARSWETLFSLLMLRITDRVPGAWGCHQGARVAWLAMVALLPSLESVFTTDSLGAADLSTSGAAASSPLDLCVQFLRDDENVNVDITPLEVRDPRGGGDQRYLFGHLVTIAEPADDLCDAALAAFPLLQRAFRALVPGSVKGHAFWCRFLTFLHVVSCVGPDSMQVLRTTALILLSTKGAVSSRRSDADVVAQLETLLHTCDDLCADEVENVEVAPFDTPESHEGHRERGSDVVGHTLPFTPARIEEHVDVLLSVGHCCSELALGGGAAPPRACYYPVIPAAMEKEGHAAVPTSTLSPPLGSRDAVKAPSSTAAMNDGSGIPSSSSSPSSAWLAPISGSLHRVAEEWRREAQLAEERERHHAAAIERFLSHAPEAHRRWLQQHEPSLMLHIDDGGAPSTQLLSPPRLPSAMAPKSVEHESQAAGSPAPRAPPTPGDPAALTSSSSRRPQSRSVAITAMADTLQEISDGYADLQWLVSQLQEAEGGGHDHNLDARECN